jgi:hypothetical protein
MGSRSVLTSESAPARFDSLMRLDVPATLNPRYVVADARRNSRLCPTFFCYESHGEYWWHGFHTTEVIGTRWRDISSPYGYGGPLSSCNQEEFLIEAQQAYVSWARESLIYAEYLRFHPLLGNHLGYNGTATPNREVVAIDLTLGALDNGYAARLRTTLRKAERAGLEYLEAELGECAEKFCCFYTVAMEEMNAAGFYKFPLAYFEALASSRLSRVGVCIHRDAPDQWLAATLLLDGPGTSEYHLAATNMAGRRASASSFLLDRAARSAQARGKRTFFLGGGTDAAPDNSLLFFKSGFSSWRATYVTGTQVFRPDAAEEIKRVYSREWEEHKDRLIYYRLV